MLVNTHDALNVVMRRLKEAKRVCYDVETSGLDAKHNHPVGHVFTLGPRPDDSYYIPIRHAGGGNLPQDIQIPYRDNSWDRKPSPVEADIMKLLSGKLIFGHHLNFDLRFMHSLGFETVTNEFQDTMVMAYLANELRWSFSLAACCKDEKVQEKKGDALYEYLSKQFGCSADKSSMAHFWRTDASVEMVWDYAGGDGTSTWQLRDALLPRMFNPYYTNANGDYTLARVFKLESDLIPVIHNMSMKGIRVDEERLTELITSLNIQLDKDMQALKNMNVKSPIAVEKYLRDNGITEFPLTPGGKPSFAEKFLMTNEPGRRIVNVRKTSTLLSNFLEPMRTRHLYNGRVHTQIHATKDEVFGTKTGRTSLSDPNLSAMPGKRQGERGKMFRSVYIPDDGMEFVEGDYMTQEIVTCAHYCRAKVWVDGFKNGVDPHTSVAEAAGINRNKAKTINLALMTGAGRAKIEAEVGPGLYDTYFDALPELREFQKQSARVFRSRGFVSTLLGRRLQLESPDKAYTAVNRLTQGGGADLLKTALINVKDLGALLPVHDSILFQVPKGAPAEPIVNAMIQAGHDVGLSIPTGVEWGRGSTWGEATFNQEGHLRW